MRWDSARSASNLYAAWTANHANDGRVCHGAIIAANRTTGPGAGKDRVAVGADRAPGRRVRRGPGSGRGTVMVARGRLSAVQRHPQKPPDEARARQGRRLVVPGADQPRERPDP